MAIKRIKRSRRVPTLNTVRLENSHAARVLEYLSPMREILRSELFPYLDMIASESRTRSDDITDTISAIFGKIRVRYVSIFNVKRLERNATLSAEQVSNAGGDVFRRQVRSVMPADPLMAEPWLHVEIKAFVKENAALIQTMPGEMLSDVEQLIFREGRRGAGVKEITEKILDRVDMTEAHARLIARDQVKKFNGKLTGLRQRNIGITRHTWQTSKDGRVRNDHKQLDGKVFSWSDPPVTVTSGKRAGERNHPGEDIECRCNAIPLLDDLLS